MFHQVPNKNKKGVTGGIGGAKSSEDNSRLLSDGIPFIYAGENRFARVLYTKQNLSERFEIELSESRDGPYKPRFSLEADEGGALGSIVVYDPEGLITICSAGNSDGYKKILHSMKEPIEKLRDFAEALMSEFIAAPMQAEETDSIRDISKELHTLGEIKIIAKIDLEGLRKAQRDRREAVRS